MAVEIATAVEIVLDCFVQSGEPLRPADVVKATGLEKTDVDKAIKALKKDGRIDSPKRCYYAAVK
ncbi:MAG: MarR family transcriptional regulator [Coriobacteriia bacterium]|nr:MarR family transcriptional regulator [Coriobacteriia bacterium]